HKRFLHDDLQRQGFRKKLALVAETILKEVPGAAIASDQPYREYDLGIDFREDVTPLAAEEVRLIKDIFKRMGAHAKISSIHVNGWFGDFDKLTTAKLWAQERLGVDLEDARDRFAFCGDSPNDEPMFAFFPLSFGVANVRPFLDMIECHPALITTREHGAGFCEITDLILQARTLAR
ncbi:MAG TPA: HAD family hydrolase, partial [bacterium]|nr:HAD family hydrolase [bacterium]